MSTRYAAIAFTDHVRDEQDRHGSGGVYARHVERGKAAMGPDPIDDSVRAFLATQDSFYLATVSETGWPYVQHRGGGEGFLQVLDEHTVGWADFRGNLQHVSTGNLATEDRASLLIMDHARQRRLKIYGRVRVIDADDDPALVARLAVAGDDGLVERAMVVDVEAFDWNCPQHITPRYTLAELEPHLAVERERLEALQAENAVLRERLAAATA